MLAIKVIEELIGMGGIFEYNKCVVHIPVVEDRFEVGRALFKPDFLVMTKENVSNCRT